MDVRIQEKPMSDLVNFLTTSAFQQNPTR